MQFDELRFVCQQAAVDALQTKGRPLPPTVVLPGPARTRLLTLSELPEDDESRHAVFAQLAEDHVTADSVPCWGFVAEAEIDHRDGVVVVFGARRHAPHVTAAFYDTAEAHTGEVESEGSNGIDRGDTLDEFLPDEELDPTAMPFLHPLQHAVDSLPAAGDVFADADPKRGGGGLPIIS